MLFDDLLSFHKPTAPKGADYWFAHVAHLFSLGLDSWDTPRYPSEWKAGKFERFAIKTIHQLKEQDEPISAEAISAAYTATTS